MTKTPLQHIRPLFILFAIMSVFFISGKAWLIQKGVDFTVVIIGNLLLFLVSLVAWLLNKNSFDNKNPHAFVRALNTAFITKFMVLALAAFVYIYTSESKVNKPALFICGGLYILYTAIEVSALLKVLRKKKDA